MKENILDVLKNLNFTEYESKAYLALLEESPLTGYAVAKKSGVPRSKIYEVLESLVIRGDIFVSYGGTPQYIPVPAKELIKNRRLKAEETFEQAEKYFEKFERTANDRENIWNITGRSEIIDKVKACISSAGKRILLEIWKEDFPELEPELKQAAKKASSSPSLRTATLKLISPMSISMTAARKLQKSTTDAGLYSASTIRKSWPALSRTGKTAAQPGRCM